MADASRAQSLVLVHLRGLDGDLNELRRVYNGLMAESKDMVNEQDKECLMYVASALDTLQEDFRILVRLVCDFNIQDKVMNDSRCYQV